MQTAIDDYLSPRHRTLKLIATAADILAYVTLVFYVFWAVAGVYGALRAPRVINPLDDMGQQLVRQTVNWVLTALNALLRGVIFWVLLTGLSLGLRMVVETDVNYRLGSEEVEND